MNDLYPKIKSIEDRAVERIKQILSDDVMPEFINVVKDSIELANRRAVDAFYISYTPRQHSRSYELYNITHVDANLNGLENSSITLSFNEKIEKPSWHNTYITDGFHRMYDKEKHQVEGYPEYIYEPVFKEGYHGGRGKNHTWWKLSTAAQEDKSPYELLKMNIRNYADNKAQHDFETIWNKHSKNKLDDLV